MLVKCGGGLQLLLGRRNRWVGAFSGILIVAIGFAIAMTEPRLGG